MKTTVSPKDRERLIKLCQDLLKIRSYSGEEEEVVRYLRKTMETIGFDDILIDRYGSITGRLTGDLPGKKILFDVHIDTVPVTDPSVWKFNPFGGEVSGGKIYGRGASDMKGSLAAMLTAASLFRQAHKAGFSGEIAVSCTVHEECFEGIAAREISGRVQPDFVVIGEASELNLKIGQRGRAEIAVETMGKAAHSSNPQAGKNAVYGMMPVIEAVRQMELSSHPVLGSGINELVDIISTPYPGASVVPEKCRATYDRRLLVGETAESVIAPFQQIAADAGKSGSEVHIGYTSGAETCYTGERIEGTRFFPAWLMDENDEVVRKSLAALRDAGLDPEITAYSFCTNGSHYAGEAGIPTVGFGPSREQLAHIVDEYIETEQIEKACVGYLSLMQAFCL